MSVQDVVVMIPAYNPDDKFIAFLDQLKTAGYEMIIVIDDGSRADTRKFFETARDEYGCDIVRHSVNLGQGRAYKSGFNRFLGDDRYRQTLGVIQCDCDGQHCVEDVDRCAALLRQNPASFILGVRDFSDRSVPFRSRFGNQCTSFVFKFFCGLDVKDTQTGLKGIPASLLPTLMEVPGERFEYASSVLLETKKAGMKIVQFPIRTIYINGNETSHFNPVLDSIRIYSLILRYLLSSLSGFVLDICLYSLLIRLLDKPFPEYYIVISTYLSRMVLSLYVFFINKKIVFHNNGKTIPTALKFLALCVMQATISGFSVRYLVALFGSGKILFKLLVDTLLFFASFQIQDRWVFRNKYVSDAARSTEK